MQFITLAAFFGAAMAAPFVEPTEEFTITNYTIATFPTLYPEVSFLVSGTNGTDLLCKSGEYKYEPMRANFFECPFADGSSMYRFDVVDSTTDPSGYQIQMVHQLAPAYGISATNVQIPTECFDSTPGSKTCTQSAPYVGTMTLRG